MAEPEMTTMRQHHQSYPEYDRHDDTAVAYHLSLSYVMSHDAEVCINLLLNPLTYTYTQGV